MKTEADIRNAMQALPKNTLNELYEEDFIRLSRSGQQTRSYAIQVFSMLLCTQEALSPEALIQAIAKTVSHEGETMTLAKMIDICFNLVVLDSELNVLRFAHISFQEFLETRIEFAPHYVHRVAARNCLDFCLEGLPAGMETDLSPRDNFHYYSAIYWAEHCRITLANGADDSITSKMQEFVFDRGDVALGFVDWIQEVNKFTKKLPNDHALLKELHSVIHSGGSPLFTACMFGLAPIIDDLAHATDYDWNQTNDLGQSGLYLAAAAGHKTIVQSLLQHEVNVNTFGGKFGHPLHAACFRGHTSMVEILLDHGADPKLGPRSALEYALLADHEDVALLLLDGKFDVSDQAEYDSILQQAAEAGFSDVVQFLQKQYASLYGDLLSSGCKAIEIAIFKGRIGVVERYMQNLSDPKIDMPADAIATAALGGQDTMINLLVDQGLDLNEEGILGTPLRAASIMCHESTVRLLLRLGASLYVSGSFGEPLQAAAMRGHESITKSLLSHGADVNSKGGLYGTALQAAAHRGHQKVVEILLDAGADVYRHGFSRDAFHAASEGGHEGIVRLLLERGFKVQHPLPPPIQYSMSSSPYRNLLRDASPSRHRETKPTWDHQPRSKDWRERASMIDFSHVLGKMRGAVTSELELVQPYRERFGYQDDGEVNYALRAAAAKGHVTVVELLLSQLDKIDIPKSGIVAAFKEACENGHEKVVNQLLSDRVEAKDLRAALEAAALKGHLTVVNILIDHEDRLGLARVETVRIGRRVAKGSNPNICLTSQSWTQVRRSTHLSVPRRGC
jgi:ankyrin repeat protein